MSTQEKFKKILDDLSNANMLFITLGLNSLADKSWNMSRELEAHYHLSELIKLETLNSQPSQNK